MAILSDPPKDLPADEAAKFKVEQARIIAAFNANALKYIRDITAQDTTTAKGRRAIIWVLAFIIVIGGLTMGIIALVNDNTPGAIVATAAVVAIIAIAAFLNPLQTVERDVVYRRWSDMIVASFFLIAADDETDLAATSRAARNASSNFALLAASYGKVAAGSAAAITAIVNAAAKVEVDEDEDEKEEVKATSIVIATPADQKGTVGAAVTPLTLDVKAPKDANTSVAGNPTWLKLDGLVLSGTPDKEDEHELTLTVSSASIAQEATAKFKWSIAAAVS